jgi:nicotinamide-nucleotide adenylyltransferase
MTDPGLAASIRGALDRARRPGRPRLEVLGATSPVRRLGLIPGSFDPMTIGHAALADALGADLSLFVYSPSTLPKEHAPVGAPEPSLLSQQDRVASLVAYCLDRPARGVALCSHGLLVDQAEAAAASFPLSRLVLGVGSDKLVQLADPRWYRDRDDALDRLFTLAEVAFALRTGDEGRILRALDETGRWRDRLRRVRLPPEAASVSSRAVRAALRLGGNVESAIPPEVRPFVSTGAGSP